MTLSLLNRGLGSFLTGSSRREEAQTSPSQLSTLNPQPTDQSLSCQGQFSVDSACFGSKSLAVFGFARRLPARVLAWWRQAQQRSPRKFTTGVLLAAIALALAHYAFGDWVIYPKVTLWKEWAFWAVVPSVVCVPLLHWLAWTAVSFGRLKPAPVILAAATILCLGDLVCYLVWINLKAVGLDFQRFAEYWDWWAYWLPVVVVGGNLFLVRRWCQMFRLRRSDASSPQGESAAPGASSCPHQTGGLQESGDEGVTTTPMRRGVAAARAELMLKVAAVFLVGCAVMLTTIHLLVPRMAVNDFTLAMADTFLVRNECRKDFDFVVQNSVSRGKRLGALLEHSELAHLQRHQFYAQMDESVYQPFVLSPVVDRLPLSELDWRRTLWENFYPRVRREHDPAVAAQVVVRFLRERVGIDPVYSYRVGVETIWSQQMTDAIGFDRIYVAALRSVGIAARLNADQRAELWTGLAWQEAPRPIVADWSSTHAQN